MSIRPMKRRKINDYFVRHNKYTYMYLHPDYTLDLDNKFYCFTSKYRKNELSQFISDLLIQIEDSDIVRKRLICRTESGNIFYARIIYGLYNRHRTLVETLCYPVKFIFNDDIFNDKLRKIKDCKENMMSIIKKQVLCKYFYNKKYEFKKMDKPCIVYIVEFNKPLINAGRSFRLFKIGFTNDYESRMKDFELHNVTEFKKWSTDYYVKCEGFKNQCCYLESMVQYLLSDYSDRINLRLPSFPRPREQFRVPIDGYDNFINKLNIIEGVFKTKGLINET